MTQVPFDVYAKDFVAIYDDLSVWSAMAGELLLKEIPMGRETGPWEKVLDIGCGTGFPLAELAGRFGPACQLTGLDMWEEAIVRVLEKIKQWRLKNVDLSIGDAAAMEFGDNSFDLIVSNLGVNNFAAPEKVLEECKRVLVPQGTLALTTNLTGHMKEFYGAFAQALTRTGASEAIEMLDQHVAHRGTIESVVAQLETAGFKVARTKTLTKSMRYRNWDAFWSHAFINLAFKPTWLEIAAAAKVPDLFDQVAAHLEPQIRKDGEFSLSVPLAYVEAQAMS